jgi:CRP-like cAMP-binding protein
MGATGDFAMTSRTGARSLDGITLLRELSPADRAKLAQRCQWRTYKTDQVIIDRDDDCGDVYMVVEGRVRVVNYALSGREVHLDDVVDGGHFGDLAALDGGPRSASVVALSESTIAVMSPALFTQTLAQQPQMSLTLMRNMARVIRQSTTRIMDLSTLGANNRVQAEVLRLARQAAGEDATSAVLKPAPVHADIASRVSTARETVARVLSDLARAGLVERQGDSLKVVDLAALEERVHHFRGD